MPTNKYMTHDANRDESGCGVCAGKGGKGKEVGGGSKKIWFGDVGSVKCD